MNPGNQQQIHMFLKPPSVRGPLKSLLRVAFPDTFPGICPAARYTSCSEPSPPATTTPPAHPQPSDPRRQSSPGRGHLSALLSLLHLIQQGQHLPAKTALPPGTPGCSPTCEKQRLTPRRAALVSLPGARLRRMTPRALAGCCVSQSHPRPVDNLPSHPVPDRERCQAPCTPLPAGRAQRLCPGGRTGHTTRPLPLPAWPGLAAFLPCLLSGCLSLSPRFGAAGRSAVRGGATEEGTTGFPTALSLFSFPGLPLFLHKAREVLLLPLLLPPVPPLFCPKLPAKPRLPGISLWQVGGSHAVPVPGLEAKAARPARGRPGHPQLGEGLRGAEAGVPEQGGPL